MDGHPTGEPGEGDLMRQSPIAHPFRDARQRALDSLAVHLRARRLALRLVFASVALGLILIVAGTALAGDPSPAPTATAADPSTSPTASTESSGSPAPSSGPAASPTPALPIPPAPTPIAHPSDGNSNQCYDCHLAVNDRQRAIAEAWQASIHGKGGVTCADCHGGDPRSDRMGVAMDRSIGFIGIPDREQTVGMCGSCHSDVERMRQYGLNTDQYAKYWTSVHGQRLASAKDTRVAICIDCHGSHDVKKASDPTAPVYPPNVPALCASCHADASRMQPYGIKTDQFEIYSKSVHGRALLEKADLRAPSCVSCHGSHGAKPPRDTEVVEVCGKCHTATQELYLQSRHAELDKAAPKCWTCHGTHDVSAPSERLFFHPEPPQYLCATCHDLANRSLRIQLDRFADEADRRCDTCHHPDSDIYAQVKAIAGSLAGAETAYDDAEHRIGQAAGLGMLVSDADVALSEAKTSLIQAQAAVHTTKLTLIAGTAGEAQTKAESAAALAQAKLDESVFRREAMVIVVALILLNVIALFFVKRALERRRRDEPGGPSAA